MSKIKEQGNYNDSVLEDKDMKEQTDDLCGWCCCSLAYGYQLYRGIKFCSQECIDDATEQDEGNNAENNSISTTE
jgi:hypothetical protein